MLLDGANIAPIGSSHDGFHLVGCLESMRSAATHSGDDVNICDHERLLCLPATTLAL